MGEIKLALAEKRELTENARFMRLGRTDVV